MEPTTVFDWAEYSVFGGMLLISAGIGIYFGCIKGGQDTVSGYLFGSKELSVFPIALSLVTGCISGITLLGVPTEIYSYGTLILMQQHSHAIAALITIYMIIPLFHGLQLISVFQYMEMRFGKAMRKLTSAISIISQLTYLPIVLYGPAVALNQVTGVNVHVITTSICAVCIFYTTLGGLKAVVWTDTIQGIFMVASVLAVLCLGINYEGGLSHVWHSALKGDRIEFFNFDPDLTTRVSFWWFTACQICSWLVHYGYNPAAMQRYIALPTVKQAQQACALMVVGITFFMTLCGGIGIVLYAAYQHCDPLSAKMISKPDQILPLYILKFSKIIPGLPAIFMCGIVSAALSTLSACFNTFSGVIYEDFVEGFFKEKPSEKTSSLIMKFIVVVFGVVCLLLVLIVEKLGSVYEVSMTLNGAVVGVMLGIFFMGTFLPWVTRKGAYVGGSAGLATMCWLAIGFNLAKTSGKIHYDTKPMSVSGCPFNVTLPHLNSTHSAPDDVFYAFRISSLYYFFIGFLVTTTVGLLVSFGTGANDLSKLDPKLFVPLIRRRLGSRRSMEDIVYNSVPLVVQTDTTEKNDLSNVNAQRQINGFQTYFELSVYVIIFLKHY